METPVISVRGVSKRYILGAMAGHDTLRDHLAHGASALLRAFRPGPRPDDKDKEADSFWALKDVSFDLNQGEVLGVVGANGAGKSTLLKILSQITEPTEGEVRMRGRVASLLEVGTGFHPELSGRENVFLNGAVLGMSRKEIRAKFDEIVAFAEVEKFLDTPVKRYSSGMYVRLAFAVAAHLEPEILIVDEVLAVGDSAFQKKCLGKMSDVASAGRTVLFVSHNLSAVQRLCTAGLFLEKGRVQHVGKIETVLDAYQRSFERPATSASAEGRPIAFLDWQVSAGSAEDTHSCFSRDDCTMTFRLQLTRSVPDVVIGFVLWNDHGDLVVAGQSSDDQEHPLTLDPGLHEISITVRLPIKAGLYQIDVSVNSGVEGHLERCFIEPKLHVLPRLITTLPEKWHGLLTERVAFRFNRLPIPAPAEIL